MVLEARSEGINEIHIVFPAPSAAKFFIKETLNKVNKKIRYRAPLKNEQHSIICRQFRITISKLMFCDPFSHLFWEFPKKRVKFHKRKTYQNEMYFSFSLYHVFSFQVSEKIKPWQSHNSWWVFYSRKKKFWMKKMSSNNTVRIILHFLSSSLNV